MSRHTKPMTDAYIVGLRLRNAARVQGAIEQLGDRWLLHPHNAVTVDEYREFRRARAERIDLRVLVIPNATREAFQRHAQKVLESGLLIQHENKWVDPEKEEAATNVLEKTGLVASQRDRFMRGEQ